MSMRTAALLVLVCFASLACAKHRRTGDPAAAAMGGSQTSDAASSGSAGGGGIGGAGSSGSAGTAISDAGEPHAGKPDAGKPDARKPDAGKPDAGKPDAGDERDDDCTVALRLDTCCFDGVAVTYRQLRADPCLAAYPDEHVELERYESCKPDGCEDVMCGSHRPPSYVALPSDNGCAFADECTQASDCVFVYEEGTCCPCLHGMPASVALSKPCYVAESEDPESSAACLYKTACIDNFHECSAGVACVADDAVPTCVIRDSFNICQ